MEVAMSPKAVSRIPGARTLRAHRLAAGVALVLLAAVAPAVGAPADRSQPVLMLHAPTWLGGHAPARRPSRGPSGRLSLGVSGATSALAVPEMGHRYQGLGGVRIDYTQWLTQQWAGRIEVGAHTGRGTALVVDPLVQVERNSAELTSTQFMLSVLRRWGGSSFKQPVWPYYGLGVGVLENDETIDLRAVDASLDTLEVRTGTTSSCFAVAALAGLQFRIRGRLHGVVEARWLKAGPGKFSDGAAPKDEIERQIYREFVAMIHRPDYDVTGWQGSAGLRWAF
jgi:hypothetical protein